MSKLALADVVTDIRDLPSLPLVVIELLSSFEQEDASVGSLADKVAQDQALAAKTLRLANSSFYGLQHKVKTIQQAITVLGFDSVRALITAAGVIDTFAGSQHATFDFTQFWRHAIATSLCARALAREAKLNEDHAFISGLLHDIGKLVLVTRFPQRYAETMAYRNTNDCFMLDAERQTLGLDHTLVGKALAEYWKFPSVIQRAIANHHAPALQDFGDIPSIVHAANAIVYALDLTAQEEDMVPPVMEPAWNSLHISPAALRTVFRDTEHEFDEACQILTA